MLATPSSTTQITEVPVARERWLIGFLQEESGLGPYFDALFELIPSLWKIHMYPRQSPR